MKKYILILFCVSCFGQNPTQWFVLGNSNAKVNTYIGGIGGVVNTPALLAAKLKKHPSGADFNVADIRKFKVVGSNIECSITTDYSLADMAFQNTEQTSSSPTYYYDNGSKCKSLGSSTFYGSRNTSAHYFPAVQSIGAGAFYHANYSNVEVADKIIYLPNCTNIGNPNVASNLMFGFTSITQKMYANTFLQTNNAGGVDATIQDGITNRGLQVVWVLNQTPPNPITNLSDSSITSTSVQLNFTAPTGSTNAIDFYEVWINGFPYQEISGSGGVVTGLTTATSYEIEVKPVDIYYNKSSSNKVTITTL